VLRPAAGEPFGRGLFGQDEQEWLGDRPDDRVQLLGGLAVGDEGVRS
jgi:hypothetical protein